MTKDDGFNLKTLFPSCNETYFCQYNFIGDRIILSVFTIFFCIIGLVGNGYIVWLLGFRIERKPFATYILNLTVADFGLLAFLFPVNMCFNPPTVHEYLVFPEALVKLLLSLFVLTYSSHQLLLTTISIDRWVSVHFPHWYQCHRSPVLSNSICAFIWALSFALSGVPVFLLLMVFTAGVYGTVFVWSHIVSALICFFLVFISTLTLFQKVCLKSQWRQHGNLLKVILLMLVSFLLLTILTAVCFIVGNVIPQEYYILWISMKGSINPLIYFSAGRQNGGQFQERMKVVLQRVFKEERDTRVELQPRIQKVL